MQQKDSDKNKKQDRSLNSPLKNKRPHHFITDSSSQDEDNLNNNKTIQTFKEDTMAAKEFNTENPFMNYAGQAQDTWKEIYGYQLRTTQTLMDQMMKWGQTYADYLYTQCNEATKMSQDYFKSGTQFSDEARKNLYTVTEKFTKTT